MDTLRLPLLHQQASPQPMVVKFFNWYRENRQATHDMFVLTMLGGFTYFFLAAFDMTERFYAFSRMHEAWELDEIILLTVTIFSFYSTIFAVRRWQEAVNRLRQANTDSLTRLYNRRKGWEVLEVELIRMKRYHRPLSIVIVDIDHFKEVNDKYGHLIGDQVLITFAKTIQGQIRETDTLIRWGGEEFVLVMPETGIHGARAIAERTRKNIERLAMPNGIRITASFGVAEQHEKDDFDALFLRADEKLYEAKTTGRNRVI